MNRITVKLVLLGKMEDTISYLSGRTYVSDLGYTYQDLVQEGRLKVLEIYEMYKNSPISEIVSICYISLINLYKGITRKKFLCRNTGIVVDLEEAFNIFDKNVIDEIYLNIFIKHLYTMLTDEETLLMDALLYPSAELVDMAISASEKVQSKEVKLTRSVLGTFLGMNRNKIGRLLNSIKLKISCKDVILHAS